MCMLRVVLTSFCFDFSMTLQAVESYSVCYCIISPKAGIHIVHFYFKRSSVAIDIPKFVYKVNYM